MSLDRERRRRYAARAAELLRDEEVAWREGYWLRDLGVEVESEDASIEAKDTIGSVRTWLNRHGFGARNNRRSCGVCAEGALLLVLADDPTISDDLIGRELLNEFQQDAAAAASSLGYVEYDDQFTDIPSFNDDEAGDVSVVVGLLQGMGREGL